MSLSARTESKLLIAAELILIGMENLIIYSSIQARVSLRSGISLGLFGSEGACRPTIARGYQLTGTADFNGDGSPDYVLYASTRQTAIWYLSGVTCVGGAYGPTLTADWNLVAPLAALSAQSCRRQMDSSR